jgi:hypothetical protein
MKNKKSKTEAGWHVTWPLAMPEQRALAGKRQRTGALQDAARTREPWCSRQRFGVRRPSAALERAARALPGVIRRRRATGKNNFQN